MKNKRKKSEEFSQKVLFWSIIGIIAIIVLAKILTLVG
jgi:hypothetical protein